jgi:proline dehydrogenase
MTIARSVLLWVSENQTLKRILPTLPPVQRAVKRFMPGETLDDALAACASLGMRKLPTILTRLGENIVHWSEAEQVTGHYLHVLEEVAARGLDTFLSVKLTQLGFDIDRARCYEQFRKLAREAAKRGNLVWIDMEQSRYVDATIELYKNALKEFGNVGLCLQSYLYRTDKDLEQLIELDARIRLVKGAYREPPSIAYKKKSDVDESYFRQALLLLQHAKQTSTVHGIGTHDMRLIRKISREAQRINLPNDRYEFQMLYGIRTGDQDQLRAEGYRVRVLVSYGPYWYPWYIRRLAERPANVWFVVKNLLPWR